MAERDRLRDWHPESHGNDDAEVEAKAYLDKKNARRKKLRNMMREKHPEILEYINEFCKDKW